MPCVTPGARLGDRGAHAVPEAGGRGEDAAAAAAAARRPRPVHPRGALAPLMRGERTVLALPRNGIRRKFRRNAAGGRAPRPARRTPRPASGGQGPAAAGPARRPWKHDLAPDRDRKWCAPRRRPAAAMRHAAAGLRRRGALLNEKMGLTSPILTRRPSTCTSTYSALRRARPWSPITRRRLPRPAQPGCCRTCPPAAL